MPGFSNGHDHGRGHAAVPQPATSASVPASAFRDGAAPRHRIDTHGPEHFAPQAPPRAPRHSDVAVGRAIRDLRRGQSRTQKDLAGSIGVTGAQLHRYETGTTRIAASRLISLAEALGVGADSLIAAGSGRPTPAPLHIGAGGDIVELIELYGALGNARQRKALIAVARMMVAQIGQNPPAEDSIGEPEAPTPPS